MVWGNGKDEGFSASASCITLGDTVDGSADCVGLAFEASTSSGAGIAVTYPHEVRWYRFYGKGATTSRLCNSWTCDQAKSMRLSTVACTVIPEPPLKR